MRPEHYTNHTYHAVAEKRSGRKFDRRCPSRTWTENDGNFIPTCYVPSGHGTFVSFEIKPL